MNGSLVFSIPNEYPVFPGIIGIANILAFIPIAWLLYISQIAPLHNNCRYILYVWALSYGLVYGLNVIIAIMDMRGSSGFMPISIFEPHLRFIIYRLHVTCTSFCALLEIAISIERRVAIIKPRAYHFSGMAWKTLVALTVLLFCFAYFVDFCVHNENKNLALTGCALLIGLELAVLAAGAFTSRACRIKFEKTYGKSSMTARYQISEALEMARAMMPTYVTSFKLKTSAIVSFCFYLAFVETHGHLLGYLELHYFLVNAINGSYSMILLLRKHPQLRKYTMRKLAFRTAPEPKIQVRRNSVKDTETHFSQLSLYWN